MARHYRNAAHHGFQNNAGSRFRPERGHQRDAGLLKYFLDIVDGIEDES